MNIEARIEKLEEEVAALRLWIGAHEANLDYVQWRDFDDDDVLEELVALIADIRLALPYGQRPMEAVAQSLVSVRNRHKNVHGLQSTDYRVAMKADLERVRAALAAGTLKVDRRRGIVDLNWDEEEEDEK